jgi:hypothetical protein
VDTSKHGSPEMTPRPPGQGKLRAGRYRFFIVSSSAHARSSATLVVATQKRTFSESITAGPFSRRICVWTSITGGRDGVFCAA